VIFELIYKEWIRKKKPLDQVIVDYTRLVRASGLSNRELRTWITWLLDVHSIPVVGRKADATSKLRFLSMHCPWRMDEDSEPDYADSLVGPSRPKRRRA
jgi:hypothetical protein